MVKSGVGVNNRYEFIYDNDGNPHVMYYYYNGSTTPTKYYYVLNLQDDVVQLRNSSNTVIANYTYDAWGKLLGVTSSSGTAITSATHIANINPIRYRGYFYDTETKLYYCNSRYYDPQTRRFVNADEFDVLHATPGEFTDKNLFAYCDNKPVMREDNGGECWNFVVGGIVGGVVGGIVAAVDSYKSTGKVDVFKTIVGVAGGAASGVVAASGLGWVAQAGISAVSDVANQGYDIAKSDSLTYRDFSIKQTAMEAINGGITSAIGSGLGALTGKYITKTKGIADTLYDNYLNKQFSAGVRQSIGRSSSALIRQGQKYLSQAIRYDNITQGVSSVIGSGISLGNLWR